jgi:hypothetical protein
LRSEEGCDVCASTEAVYDAAPGLGAKPPLSVMDPVSVRLLVASLMLMGADAAVVPPEHVWNRQLDGQLFGRFRPVETPPK